MIVWVVFSSTPDQDIVIGVAMSPGSGMAAADADHGTPLEWRAAEDANRLSTGEATRIDFFHDVAWDYIVRRFEVVEP